MLINPSPFVGLSVSRMNPEVIDEILAQTIPVIDPIDFRSELEPNPDPGICIIYKHLTKQEAQLSQRDRAMLRIIEYFAKSLKLTQRHSR